MISTHASPAAHPAHPRRVRHQARDVAAVMGTSLALSVGLSSVLLLLMSLGR